MTLSGQQAASDTFTYNAFDQRIGKTDTSGTYTYKRDGLDVTSPVLNDSAAEYTPGVSESRSGSSSFYHADRMGSTTKITNSSQSVTDTQAYDAFGNLESSTGSNPTPFQYDGGYGYQSDADSGLMLLGHRYYDPSTGRFSTRDPAKEGRNWYAYCGSRPACSLDPAGLKLQAITSSEFVFGQLASGTPGIIGTRWHPPRPKPDPSLPAPPPVVLQEAGAVISYAGVSGTGEIGGLAGSAAPLTATAVVKRNDRLFMRHQEDDPYDEYPDSRYYEDYDSQGSASAVAKGLCNQAAGD